MDASSSPSSSEEGLKQELDDLQRQLNKKLRFEESVRSIHFLLRDRYASASPSLRKQFYTVVCRVATVLKTRYTATGFWLAGLHLFEEAERLVSNAAEKEHLKSCIAQAKEELNEVDNPPTEEPQNNGNRGYLFEGHLTVDPEPPQPQWLVQQNLMSAFASIVAGESSRGPGENNDAAATADLMQELINSLDSVIPEILEVDGAPPRAPPASKEVVAKLPVIVLTEEVLNKLGPEPECCICKENLVVGDKMQELPCKHTFHPPCLKPWLDEHNSCPICRHELPTDDHRYESWKEREKEAEEERKGAENAVRGGEYMYV
ncbi:PREDICTED: E3 ubiquitin-protein ligase AIP2 [Tarenaya hassleriana]|uniref:E3 ubiquitin-protein ligase AIP2 n=1 Tax=Tarenaya hassleriana TaxID=28532 RepID=UPI00053C5192|nr:PREDICTED: E3 ubiquitin-protein ligase AIP2 [Tarenaya hassleriana]